MRHAEALISFDDFDTATQLLDTMSMGTVRKTNIVEHVLDSIRTQLFIASSYVLCDELDRALYCIKKARDELGKSIMGVELIRKRLYNNGDVGRMSMLPDLCQHMIAFYTYI